MNIPEYLTLLTDLGVSLEITFCHKYTNLNTIALKTLIKILKQLTVIVGKHPHCFDMLHSLGTSNDLRNAYKFYCRLYCSRNTSHLLF